MHIENLKLNPIDLAITLRGNPEKIHREARRCISRAEDRISQGHYSMGRLFLSDARVFVREMRDKENRYEVMGLCREIVALYKTIQERTGKDLGLEILNTLNLARDVKDAGGR